MINDLDKSLLTFLANSSIEDIKYGKDDAGISYLKHVHEIHKNKIGVICSSCPYKQDGYIRNVQSFLKNHSKMDNKLKSKDETEYQLKQGALVRFKGKSYSSHNLTDDIAKEFLSENKNRKVLFVKLPKNWEANINELSEADAGAEKSTEADAGAETKEESPKSKSTFEQRKEELDELHWKQLSDLVEELGHDYSLLKKDKSIEVILQNEYPEEFSEEK